MNSTPPVRQNDVTQAASFVRFVKSQLLENGATVGRKTSEDRFLVASRAEVDGVYRRFLSQSISYEDLISMIDKIVNQVKSHPNRESLNVWKAFCEALDSGSFKPRATIMNAPLPISAPKPNTVPCHFPSKNDITPNSEQLEAFIEYLYKWLDDAVVRNGARVEKKVLVIRNDIGGILHHLRNKDLSWDESLRQVNESVCSLSRSLRGFCIYKCFRRHHKNIETNPIENKKENGEPDAEGTNHRDVLQKHGATPTDHHDMARKNHVMSAAQREATQIEEQTMSEELTKSLENEQEINGTLNLEHFVESMRNQSYSLDDLGRFAVRLVRSVTHLRPGHMGAVGNLSVEEIKQTLRKHGQKALDDETAEAKICSLVRDSLNLELDVIFRYYLTSASMTEQMKEKQTLRKGKQTMKDKDAMQGHSKKKRHFSPNARPSVNETHSDAFKASRGIIEIIPGISHLQKDEYRSEETQEMRNVQLDGVTLEGEIINTPLLHNRLQHFWSTYEITGTVSRACVSYTQAAISHHIKHLLTDMVRERRTTGKKEIDTPTALQVFARNGKLKRGSAYFV